MESVPDDVWRVQPTQERDLAQRRRLNTLFHLVRVGPLDGDNPAGRNVRRFDDRAIRTLSNRLGELVVLHDDAGVATNCARNDGAGGAMKTTAVPRQNTCFSSDGGVVDYG